MAKRLNIALAAALFLGSASLAYAQSNGSNNSDSGNNASATSSGDVNGSGPAGGKGPNDMQRPDANRSGTTGVRGNATSRDPKLDTTTPSESTAPRR